LGFSINISEANSIKDIKEVMHFIEPELLDGSVAYSPAADIYSFGMLMPYGKKFRIATERSVFCGTLQKFIRNSLQIPKILIRNLERIPYEFL